MWETCKKKIYLVYICIENRVTYALLRKVTWYIKHKHHTLTIPTKPYYLFMYQCGEKKEHDKHNTNCLFVVCYSKFLSFHFFRLVLCFFPYMLWKNNRAT